MRLLIVLSILLNSIICNAIDVKTSSGVVRGQTIDVLNQKVNQFLGIPFAEPPIGDLRFAKPKPIDKPLADVIDATESKNSCHQFKTGYLMNDNNYDNLTHSEDCLFLNVWSQTAINDSALKPVMFWIHGSFLMPFSSGSIFQSIYNGSVLATHDVVFVSANYRLGPFGFLYGNDSTAPGNVGLYDQVLALKWVRDNIHSFGGDKDRITIFGDSAGSQSVSAHILPPESKGLFKRAILLNNVFLNHNMTDTTNERLVYAKHNANRLNCSGDDWLSCMKHLDHHCFPSRSLDRHFPFAFTEFQPISPQKALKDGIFNTGIELMAGVTDSLTKYFAKRYLHYYAIKTIQDFKQRVELFIDDYSGIDVQDFLRFYVGDVHSNDSRTYESAFLDFYADFVTNCRTYLFAKKYGEHSADKSKLYFYELEYEIASNTTTDIVLQDVAYVFVAPLLYANEYTEREKQISERVIHYWTNFAKYGKPSIDGDDDFWEPMLQKKIMIKKLVMDNTHFVNMFQQTCDGIKSGKKL